jgi:cold shock protein
MPTGKIKWFDNGTGYGFIQPDNGSLDVFFHSSALRDQSGSNLQKGNEVLFQTEANPRGPEAIAITLIKIMPEP